MFIFFLKVKKNYPFFCGNLSGSKNLKWRTTKELPVLINPKNEKLLNKKEDNIIMTFEYIDNKKN